MTLFILTETQRRGFRRHQKPEEVSGRHLCSSRGCLQVSASAAAVWGGRCLSSAAEAESHGGNAAAQIWAEAAA